MNDTIRLPGYEARPAELAALRFLLNGRVAGARALFIEGAPGVGKTFLGEALARGQEWPVVFYQCHSWSSDQELFEGVNVAAAVAGDADAVRQDGALLAAAKRSIEGRVILIVDEIDKAPERVDALLLDFLQGGRVPSSGGVLQGNLENLLVFITSNQVREPHPALTRRCRRVRMAPLPNEVFDRLLGDRAALGPALARQIRRLCKGAAGADGQETSLQEAVNFGEELKFASSPEEVELAAEGWAVRGPKGLEWLASKEARQGLAEIWRLVESCRK
jgi:MoxR-like ATPase